MTNPSRIWVYDGDADSSLVNLQAYLLGLAGRAKLGNVEEQRIGTWFGSEIYRAVVDLGSLPNTTTKTVEPIAGIIGTVLKIYGFASNREVGGTNTLPLPHSSPTLANNIALYFNGESVVVETGSDRTSYAGFAVIEYTRS